MSRIFLIFMIIVAATVFILPGLLPNSGNSSDQGSQSAASASKSSRSSRTADELTETSFSSTKEGSSTSYVIEFHDKHVCYLTQAENGDIAGVSKGSYSIKDGTLAIQDIPAIKGATYDGEDTLTLEMTSGTWTFKLVSALNDERLLESMAEKLGPAS